MRVVIGTDGSVRFIYSDDAAAVVARFSRLRVARASHVEPAAGGGWTADMGPVGGPVLGPFETRAEALAREVEWLESAGTPVPA